MSGRHNPGGLDPENLLEEGLQGAGAGLMGGLGEPGMT